MYLVVKHLESLKKDVLERIKIVNSKECITLSVSYQFIGRELFQFVVSKSEDSVKGEYPMPSDRQKVDKGLRFFVLRLKVFKDEKQKDNLLGSRDACTVHCQCIHSGALNTRSR